MTAVTRLNGVDLSTLGWYLDAESGVYASVGIGRTGNVLAGRAGSVFSGPARIDTRTITVKGTLQPSTGTVANRRTGEAALKDAFMGGLVRLEIDDDTTPARQIEGYAERVEITPTGHPLLAVVARLEARLVCPSPFWRDVEPTTRSVAATATRYTVPLGTAPSSPIIRVMGSATTPTLTYRDAGGASVWTMTLATLASDEYLDIDMGRGKITFYDSGVSANGMSKLTSGNFPWALDPQDGDYTTSAWPTVEISAGSAEILWYRGWL